MPLYMLIVAYDGTRFHGFQRQVDNAAMTVKAERPRKRPMLDQTDGTRKHCNVSVQEVLELVILQDLCPGQTTIEEMNLKFAGRTDKGVHARGQAVTVQLPPGETRMNVWKLRQSINSRLPVDISVVRAELLTKPLDPRKDVIEKRYSYTIKYQRKVLAGNNGKNNNDDMMGGPLNSIRHALVDPPCMWVCPWVLDDALLPKLLNDLQGTHDYSAFVHKAARQAKDNTLTDSIDFAVTETRIDHYIPDSEDSETDPIPVEFITARFDFAAKGFRRTMLRNIVGYCVDVCRGLEATPTLEQVFDSSSNVNAPICAAPAAGLCLESVTY